MHFLITATIVAIVRAPSPYIYDYALISFNLKAATSLLQPLTFFAHW